MLMALTLMMHAFSVSALAAQKDGPRLVTTVTITDLNTGEVTEQELGNTRTSVSLDKDGNRVYTSTVTLGASINQKTTQASSDIFGGWKGLVEITYTDDGTYACLTRAQVMWEKVSGSNTCTNVNLSYWQHLFRRSEDVVTGDFTGIGVFTRFSPEKYGYNLGYELGASSKATIGTNRYEIKTVLDF